MAGSSGLPQCGFCPPWAGCQGVRDGSSCMWGWPVCQLRKLGVHMPKNLVTGVRVRQQIAAAPVVPSGENFQIGTRKRWRDAFITSGTSPATPGEPQLAFQRGTCLWVQHGSAVAEVVRHVPAACSETMLLQPNVQARVRAQLAAPTPLQRPRGSRWCRTGARWHPVRSPAKKSPCSPG